MSTDLHFLCFFCDQFRLFLLAEIFLPWEFLKNATTSGPKMEHPAVFFRTLGKTDGTFCFFRRLNILCLCTFRQKYQKPVCSSRREENFSYAAQIMETTTNCVHKKFNTQIEWLSIRLFCIFIHFSIWRFFPEKAPKTQNLTNVPNFFAGKFFM